MKIFEFIGFELDFHGIDMGLNAQFYRFHRGNMGSMGIELTNDWLMIREFTTQYTRDYISKCMNGEFLRTNQSKVTTNSFDELLKNSGRSKQ